MNGLRWGWPEAFYFFAVLALVGALFILFRTRYDKKLRRSFGARVVPWLTRSISAEKMGFRLLLELLGLSLLVIALARPQLGQSQQEIKSEGIELLVLADVSDSMLSEDVQPSRLEMMKVELEKLVDLMPGNKMGLIAFAGTSALMCPLTSDPSALKMYIQGLDTLSVSSQGTNFETALAHAGEAFEKGGITEQDNVKATRVILVVSDGEDQEAGALEEAKKLNERGIHIITVAYGTEKGGTIPARDQFGSLTGSRKDASGQPIITSVKGEFLKQLAEQTKGKFFFSRYGGSHLRDIVATIDRYEKAQFASAVTVQYDEKFGYPLAAGIAILMLSCLVSGRKRAVAERKWKGMYEI